MGRKVQQVPCAECTQKCRFFHGKEKSSSPVLTSFFKIMLGDDFSSVLYIPPKFSRTSTMSALLNKKIILKDSSRKQWEVTVLIVDGSFAFKDGWDAFSLYHGLKVGDFVLFSYINESYFDVSIFDKSGCERLHFSEKRKKRKRNRDRSGSPVRHGMLVREGSNASVVSKPDVPKMKSQHREVDIGGTQNNIENVSKYDNNRSAQSVCIAEHCEDPCYMTSRDFADKERDDKSSMFDVLDCEIWNNCGVDRTWKITTGDSKVSHVDHGSHVYQNDAIVCNKDPLFEGILGRGAASDASKFELSRRNNSLRETDKSAYDKTSTLKLEENRKNNSIMSNREVQECQFAEGLESDRVVISKTKHVLRVGGFHNTKQMFNGIPNISDAIHNGEMLKMTKKKHADMTPNFCSFKDKLRATGIKKEPMDMTSNEKDELGATGEMSKPIKKVLVDMTPNVYKDEFLATGEMSKPTKKVLVDMTPNVYKDEFPATVEMSKRIKKELEDMTPNKYKDELPATGLLRVKGELGQSSPTFNQDNENHFLTAATVSCVLPTDNDYFLVRY